MTTTAHPTPTAPAASKHSGITMVTRTRIELRKLVDTRSSTTLLAVMFGLLLLAIPLLGVFAPEDLDLRGLMSEGSAPLVFLLPVVGMLAIAGEWRHRTALWTYALDPARSRVLTAKLIAIALLTLAAVVVTLVIALIVVALVGDTLPSPRGILDVAAGLLWAIGGMTLVGAALGAALLNAPLALTVFFLVPQLIPQLLRAWSTTAPIAPYVDAHAAFLGGFADRPAAQAPELASVVMLWIVLPMVVGFIRNARQDV